VALTVRRPPQVVLQVRQSLLQVNRGAVGPKGEPGISGGIETYAPPLPLAAWPITHGLGHRPQVTVTDLAGTVVYPDVQYTGVDQILITFPTPFDGFAYLG
jgi:hypothetical protein